MPANLDIISLGCRLNLVESEAMRRLAGAAGLKDAVVINTCAVTNEAVRTARQNIRRARRARPGARIIVTGCAAQTAPDDFAAMTEVDAVIGNQEKLAPHEWRTLAQAPAPGDEDAPTVRVNDIMSVRETAGHLIDGYGDHARAFLQIQNGCDHRCTFCIIPFGRGNSRSVPVSVAVEQAKQLTAAGHHEIVLTGVDMTSYGGDLDGAPTLGALVAALLDQVPALARLRLSSVDGAEIDAELFERITSDSRVAPYLHLSLQSGDNMILKRMKRRHTREQAIELCHNIRARRADVAFGADIIAGFPTETEQMFAHSLNIIDEAGLQYLHVFPFSPRQGTPAALMPQVPRTIVKERAARLRAKAADALHGFLDTLVGHEESAIMESGGRARLGNFASVKVLNGETAAIGATCQLRLTARAGDILIGEAI
ncbi:MAG: tRNA (N(6)-L-threonylcarbamoyladenosine(37)-C(2))-methylthiotransferase MtaB [Alphaproteobacteria bacterium]|nr:tRNA (N(6)-L-threonylcarbamoyladenosine(37)-C(2))-methylthiotransferase MtaB [Alphaproteobacteria bacterium]